MKKIKYLYITFFLIIPFILNAQQLAFEGALGHGRFATGGRGGEVRYVTNLNDTGSGSFRTAVSGNTPKTVIFRVGGGIQATTTVTVGDNTTIAGQTAPGGGIALYGAELRVIGSNVIIRHFKTRLGSNFTGSNADGAGVKSYSGVFRSDVIFDHCEITWADDEVIDFGEIGDNGGGVARITVQNCIVGEGITRAFNILLWQRANDISFIKNAIIHGKERNIRSSTCDSSFEMINNLIYNFNYGTIVTYENYFDVVNNLFITKSGSSVIGSIVSISSSTNNCPNGNISLTRGHVDGNLWDNGSTVGNITINSSLNPYLQATRQNSSGYAPIVTNLVEDYVLTNAGARVFPLDAAGARHINEITNRTGTYKTSLANAGGYPTISNGTPYTDTDGDGMSDAYEDANGLNKNNAADRNTYPNNDGYTALENFLNQLAGDEAPSTGDAPTSIDIQGGAVELSVFEAQATQLNTSILPEGSNQGLIWESSNPSIASVSSTGLVTGLTIGQVIITATSSVDGNVFDSITVKVTENAPIETTIGSGVPKRIIINN